MAEPEVDPVAALRQQLAVQKIRAQLAKDAAGPPTPASYQEPGTERPDDPRTNPLMADASLSDLIEVPRGFARESLNLARSAAESLQPALYTADVLGLLPSKEALTPGFLRTPEGASPSAKGAGKFGEVLASVATGLVGGESALAKELEPAAAKLGETLSTVQRGVREALAPAIDAGATAEQLAVKSGIAKRFPVLYHGADEVGTAAIEESKKLGSTLHDTFLTHNPDTAKLYAEAKKGKIFRVRTADIPAYLLEDFDRGAVAIPANTVTVPTIPENIATTSTGEPAPEEVQRFVREASGRAIARIREALATGKGLPSGDIAEAEEMAIRLEREARSDLMQRSAEALRAGGATDAQIADHAGKLEEATKGWDPTALGIAADSASILPPSGGRRFVEMLAGAGGAPSRVANLSAQIREFRSAAMVSGIGTQMRNNLGNLVQAAMRPAHTATAALWDIPVSLLTKERQAFLVEAPAEAYGMWRSLPTALRQLGRQSRSVREAIVAEAEAPTLRQEILQSKGAIPGWIGSHLVRPSLRLLNVADQAWHTRIFSGEMYRLAAAQAAKEGTTGRKLIGRVGEILDEQNGIASQIGELRDGIGSARKALADLAEQRKDVLRRIKAGDPLVEKISRTVNRQARQLYQQVKEDTAALTALEKKSFAKEASFVADRTIFTAREGESLDKLINWMERYSQEHPIPGLALNAVLPFRRTPANMARELLRSSPVGLGTGAIRAIKSSQAAAAAGQAAEMAPAIQRRLVNDLGQATMGTAAAYFLLHNAMNGNIKINPFMANQAARRVTKEAAGSVPDSVQIGSYSLPIAQLGVIGPLVMAAGKIAQSLKPGEPVPEDVTNQASQIALTIARESVNNDFAGPISDFFDMLGGDEKIAQGWARRYGGSYVPRAVSQFSQVYKERPKPEDVEASGVPYGLRNVVAGFKQALPGTGQAQLGLFGTERKVQAPLPSFLFGRTGKVGNDPLAQEMARVGAFHLSPDPLSPAVKTALGISDVEDRLMRMAKGHAQRAAVQAVVGSDFYKQQSPAGQKALIDYAFTRTSAAVNARVKALKLAKVPLTERAILGQ